MHKTILFVLYSTGFIFAVAVAVKGFEYYNLPLLERPYSVVHRLFKPGGAWGHGLGILGSAMMLLLLLYSLRKRNRFGLRFGKIGQWLNVHIFLGIMGPVLVTLHTAFKFGGFVSVSFYSMLAVMLSGFVGRFLYVQIPRTLSGDELTVRQMEERNQHLSRKLIEKHRMNPNSLKQLQSLSGVNKDGQNRAFSTVMTIAGNNLIRPFKIRKLKKKLLKQNGNIPPQAIDSLVEIIDQKAVLMRKMALLSAIQPMFHYWHVIHKPFAYVMFIIMFLHIGVTVVFGFRWIF